MYSLMLYLYKTVVENWRADDGVLWFSAEGEHGIAKVHIVSKLLNVHYESE